MIDPQHPGCPQCAQMAVRKLDKSSERALVDYFRCTLCGHVWSTPKDQPTVSNDVTERRRTADREKVRALKWRFDAIHTEGRKALVAGDYEGARAAIKIQREITAKLNALIGQRRARLLRFIKIS